MRIQRTLPPAAAPIYLRDLISGLMGLVHGQREIERFKSELKEYFGVKHCFLVSSGRAALTIILRALKEIHPEKDEVLIPAFTCFSVPSAIVRAGLKVKLCDNNPDTLDFDFDQFAKVLTCDSQSRHSGSQSLGENDEASAGRHNTPFQNRLLAIIPTHLFGLPADMDGLRELFNYPHITIIEDAAQAMGGEYMGKKMGTMGDVSFFSLGRGKAFSTIEGGIIITNQVEIAEKIENHIKYLKNYRVIELIRIILNTLSLTFFLNPLLFWFPKSLPFLKLGETIYDPNFKMRKFSSFQAGLATKWSDKLEKSKIFRSNCSKYWLKLIKHAENNGLSTITYGHNPGLIRFPVRVDDFSVREKILSKSQRKGFGIMPTYPDSIDGIKELKDQFKNEDFPSAKEIVKKLITLPTHSLVTQKDRDKIAALIN